MFVADRILALLAERPTLTVAEIRKALPNVRRKSIASALNHMHAKGHIESAGWSCYRLTSDATDARPAKTMTIIQVIKARIAGR